MTLEQIIKRKPELFRCSFGCDHTVDPVWGSSQQQGVYSKKSLGIFHCGRHDVRRRRENWREYPLTMAVHVGGQVLPCGTCFPELAPKWLDLLRSSYQD